jgi:glycine/D-amino acid oxidase-like deaminating enzyme/nitrite reductase/ring-hydroxylating ferredoxin subunit
MAGGAGAPPAIARVTACMRSTPWLSTPPRAYPAPGRDLSVDVAIVGAGVSGVTTAVLLKQRGYRVALLDRGRLGSGDTGHTTAHLTAVTDRPPADLLAAYGADHAGAIWDAGCAALDQIDRLVRTRHIRCGFCWVPGYLHVRPGHERAAEDAAALRDTLAACDEMGIDADWVDAVPVFGVPGVRFGQQARIEPHRYLRALATELPGGGSSVHERSEVTEITGPPFALRVGARTVHAEKLVIATHVPLQGVAGTISAGLAQSRVALYTSYAIRARIETGSLPDALFWDTVNPYRYLRLDPRRGGEYVIYGGADHKTGQKPSSPPFDELDGALQAIAPGAVVDHRWSGQVVESIDGLPFIGESAPGQFSAMGYGGNGLTFGTLAGLMAADWATNATNPWAELFAWGRTGLRAGGWRNYLAENADYPYYLIRDRFAGKTGRTARSIPRGSGRVVDVAGAAVAVYRALDGSVIQRSAICTHLGCTVAWNDTERTWDCPCHGSRFRPDGAVIAGPAEAPLTPPASTGDAD